MGLSQLIMAIIIIHFIFFMINEMIWYAENMWVFVYESVWVTITIAINLLRLL